jgi:hypothetical protein
MKFQILAAWCLFSGLVTASFLGCDSAIPKLEESGPRSTVTTTDANGVVTATLPANTAATVVASPTSTIAGSSFSVPAGALAVETEVSMGEAEDQADSILTELANGETVVVAKKGAPIYIGPTKDGVEVSQPMSLSIPLPMDTAEATKLMATTGKLVFFYSVYVGGVWKSGVKAFTNTNLVGTFLNQKIAGFGYFQIVYLSQGIAESEVTSQKRPGIKS